MPRLTRWLVKAGLVWLVVALALGVAMQLPAAAPMAGAAWPTYLHMVTVGWLTQLIVGVALWLFPRYSAERPRGSERLGWTTFALLNLGLVLRVIGEPRRALGHDAHVLLLLSAAAQLIAVGAFVLNVWPRVRER